MLGSNDKSTLTLVNAKDINGNIIPFNLQIPSNENFIIPSELASIDVFEFQEGAVNHGEIIFSIYVGDCENFYNLVEEFHKNTATFTKLFGITNINQRVCFQKKDGIKYIYAKLKEQDIVAKNHHQLIEIIEILSNEYYSIHSHIENIKSLSKKFNNSFEIID